MSEPFIGEIKAVGFDFAPVNWAKCEGQEIYISQNPALYALIRAYYGGDDRVRFNLPDLRGRCPVGGYRLGEREGYEYTILNHQYLPSHNHTFDSSRVKLKAYSGAANLCDSTDAVFAHSQTKQDTPQGVYSYTKNTTSTVMMSENGGTVEGTTSNTGENQVQPFDNMMPYLVISYIIALNGVFPQRY
ncbi:phage tail protein [Abyssisolibacter fermentans]|uniref:phage tail protein n=1 Tax=Abyssisolibacter fermentans TaxID=1766203 RepID=UPI000829D071|nr:tail fiber protein [Abyssisolibacter fermentans]